MFNINFFLPAPKEIPLAPKENNIEYVKLWMEQSKLMWGRLQFIHLLHVGVLGAWFALHINKVYLQFQIGVLSIGLFISIFLASIIYRDGKYLDAIRTLAGGLVPEINVCCCIPNGRKSAYWIIGFLCALEITIIIATLVSFWLGTDVSQGYWKHQEHP